MKRFDVILVFILFVLSSTVLFQNCSKMEAAQMDEVNSQLSNDVKTPIDDSINPEPTPAEPIPDNLSNRVISLDNKVTKNITGNVVTTFGFGGDDVFYYETDYAGVYKSTLVKIHAIDTVTYLSVMADGCEKMKQLTNDDIVQLTEIFLAPASLSLTFNDVEPSMPGCAFPRLVIDTKADHDFDFYLSSPQCTPLDAQIYEDPDPDFITDTKAFFEGHIDSLCSP